MRVRHSRLPFRPATARGSSEQRRRNATPGSVTFRAARSSTSRGEIGSSEHRPEQQSGEFAPANAERQMKQFKLAGQAQRFLSAHDQFNNLFHLRRDHLTAEEHRASRNQTFQVWDEICNMG